MIEHIKWFFGIGIDQEEESRQWMEDYKEYGYGPHEHKDEDILRMIERIDEEVEED